MTNFSWIDWTIVAAYIAGSTVVGVVAMRYVRNMGDFIVAGRSLNSALGIATMIGTELGLVTIMYAAQKGFTGGFASFHIALLAGLVALLVGWTGYIVVPLRRMGVMTIPEFYERRFSPGVRVFGGTILALSGILNMGMFLRAGADFILGVTGMESALHLNVVMTVLLALVLFYTILGGMVSIVITDYIQFVVLSFGLLVTAVLAVQHLGWDRIVSTVQEVRGESGFNPLVVEKGKDGFGPAYVMWMAFLGLVSCAIWQTSVMRACAARDTKAVRRIYVWSSLGFLIRFLIPNFLGVCALVFVWHDVDLKALFLAATGDVESKKFALEAMPLFLGRILPTGLLGLVTAGMLAAFMSTHDSYLLCWSSVLTQDVIAPLRRGQMSTRSRLLTTRVIIFAIGVFLLVWGLWYPLGDDLWDYMAITGAIYFTGAFALLGIGLYWRGASTVGAYLALGAGLLAICGLDTIREPLNDSLDTQLSGAHIGLGTVALSVVLLVVGSLCFPDSAPRRLDGDAKEKSES